jgi:hypothetical protein
MPGVLPSPDPHPTLTNRSSRLINTHIRADTKNQLLLRTKMRSCDSDIQAIRDVVTISGNLSAMFLSEKTGRESIYECLYRKLLECRKAVHVIADLFKS